MDSEMVWVNEGFVLTDAGHLIQTTYIDLRKPGDRTPIDTLIRGSEHKYALENCETVLVSKPVRFQNYGEELILDPQEGLAKQETTTPAQETASQVARQQSLSQLNEAIEILDSRMRIHQHETQKNTNTNSRSLTYGNDWWIFCTTIKPDDEDWGTWRSTLPREYDYVSEIGKPAMFAQALAHMVVDQIGPLGTEGSLRDTTEGAETEPTKHLTQWVMHGPVVYVDDVYESLSGITDNRVRIAASMFTKSKQYAAQREYRFAILNGGAAEETVILKVSGMMKDALAQTLHGLVRFAPVPLHLDSAAGSLEAQDTPETATPTLKSVTMRRRSTKRQEKRSEVRDADGKILSSDSEVNESVQEETFTQYQAASQGDAEDTKINGGGDHRIVPSSIAEIPIENDGDGRSAQHDAEAVAELAREEFEWEEADGGQEDFSIPVHTRTGRVYKSFDDMMSDPTYPMSPMGKTWQEEASTAEEITKAYRAIEVLNLKMHDIEERFQQDVASAGWYAMLCVRNIYAKIGDIVDSVWIERQRFVVIRLKSSGTLKANGRIVIAPSGAYAYTLQLPNKENLGHGGIEWGTMFFPIGNVIDTFDEYGWPKKIV
jgi:hypothetical protein